MSRPLQKPYTGPHTVISRGEKFFVIDKNGQHQLVSIDRLKPAFGVVVQDLPNVAEDQPPLEEPVPQLPLPVMQPET